MKEKDWKNKKKIENCWRSMRIGKNKKKKKE